MGGTLGNQNARKENRLFSSALRRHYVQNPEKLAKLVEKLTNAAEEGDLQFAKEVIDRVDGKSIQATELTGADGKDLFRQTSDEELDARIAELEARRK